jgi:hypothetical protein
MIPSCSGETRVRPSPRNDQERMEFRRAGQLPADWKPALCVLTGSIPLAPRCNPMEASSSASTSGAR